MALRLEHDWLWDFWTVADGEQIHAFYLKAPRSLGDPDLRHWNPTIGHAVSSDLMSWTVLDDAFGPGPVGAFDDRSTWTGSVTQYGSGWAMLYTGTRADEQGLIQRVGLATSNDLTNWQRRVAPVIEADPTWYEQLDTSLWHDQAWRDPWLFRVPGDEHVHAYLTARVHHGPPRGRGVIGHARSLDLITWQVLPPVTEPMGFGQMEVPQLVHIGSRWYLVFSSDPSTRQSDVAGLGVGTYCLSGPSPFGPFAADTLHELDAGPANPTYAGRLVPCRGQLWLLAWVGGSGSSFRGELSDPRRVDVDVEGRLGLVDDEQHRAADASTVDGAAVAQ